MFNIFGIFTGIIDFFTKNQAIRDLTIQIVAGAAQKALEQNSSKIDDHIVPIALEIAKDNKISTKTLQKAIKTINDENKALPEVKFMLDKDRKLHIYTSV